MQRDGTNMIDRPVYSPSAVYYEEADRIEYVRRDVPCVHRRIDHLLTLIFSMDSREPLGFQIKGFKNLYLRYIAPSCKDSDLEFLPLVKVIERALSSFGDDVFEADSRRQAYECALEIATDDQVNLTDLPHVA
jgi:hypothetical protein